MGIAAVGHQVTFLQFVPNLSNCPVRWLPMWNVNQNKTRWVELTDELIEREGGVKALRCQSLSAFTPSVVANYMMALFNPLECQAGTHPSKAYDANPHGSPPLSLFKLRKLPSQQA